MTTSDVTDKQLRLIVDSATDYAILSTDLKGRVTSWSNGAERLLGFCADEMHGRSADVIFTPEDLAQGAPDQERQTALRDGRAEDERWHQRKDGSLFWASGLLMPLKGEGGRPIGFAKFMRDRTAHRRTEEALDDATRGLRLAMEAGRMAIWNLDLRTDELNGSPELNRLLGFPPDATPTANDTRARYAPGELERVQAFGAEALARGDTSVEIEFRYSMPDGSERWLLLRADVVFSPEGQPLRAIGVLMDIDERKRASLAVAESEERFRLIADSAPVMLWMADPTGKATYLNRTLREFWGLGEDEVDSFDWTPTVHPEDAAPLAETFQRGMAARTPYSAEARYRRADGEYRTLRSDARPRFDASGRFLGMTGVNVDVTEARQAEASLQALNATLEDRVRQAVAERTHAEEVLRQSQKMDAVGQLTGGIAHDFNNMMAVVIGGLNLLDRAMKRGEVDVARYIEAAMDGATRAAALTQRLLAFSRQQSLSPEALDPNALVSGMTELLSRTLGEGVQIRTNLAPDPWPTLADPVQLESALLNLAVNARDAMPGGGSLSIETRNLALDEADARAIDLAPGDYVEIAVADTGQGMPREVIAQAFDPFFTTKGVGKGTGLGLSQVFGFVRQSGGHVGIGSEVGRGTTVRILLPRFAGSAAAPATRTAPPPETLRGHPREIVLVVEDEARVRNYSVEALRELGYTVVHASSGLEALRMMEDGQDVTLLFTDVVMPEMTGRQLAEQALARRPGLRVLFTTGYTRDAVVRNGMLAHGTALLPKPFGLDQLAERVRAVLDAAPDMAPAQAEPLPAQG
jgi:PAS domain S-box-containing protein